MPEHSRRAAVAALGLAIAATALPAPAAVSFERDLLPTVARRCGACHITGEEPGRMSLVPGKAWASLVGQPAEAVPGMLRVAPGDPEGSYLLHKLQGTHLDVGGSGSRMPLHQGPLPPPLVDRIREWIAAGAPDN